MKQAHNPDDNKFNEETKPRKNIGHEKATLMPRVFVSNVSGVLKNICGYERALCHSTHTGITSTTTSSPTDLHRFCILTSLTCNRAQKGILHNLTQPLL